MQRLSSVPFLTLVWCLSFVFVLLVRHLNVCATGLAVGGSLRAVAAGARADCKDVLLALAFFGSQ
eukprot:3029539-Amphidinium_carterae.1